jgi:hypothetical integral membrane protein (TIGR02206 family)
MNFKEFFSYVPQNIEPFTLFGRHHIIQLLSLVFLITLFTILARKNDKFRVFYKRFILIAIVAQEIAYRFWDAVIFEFKPDILFTLHLCSVCIILIVIIMVKYNQTIFELLYFWGLGAATQAILTPDLGVYGFPHFRFFQIFFSHGLIVAAVIYFLFVEGKRLRRGSLKRGIIYTNIYAGIVLIVNQIAGTNYMFINRTPDTPSIIDALGPWPFYLIWLELILIAVFSLIYLPVFFRHRRELKVSLQEGE